MVEILSTWKHSTKSQLLWGIKTSSGFCYCYDEEEVFLLWRYKKYCSCNSVSFFFALIVRIHINIKEQTNFYRFHTLQPIGCFTGIVRTVRRILHRNCRTRIFGSLPLAATPSSYLSNEMWSWSSAEEILLLYKLPYHRLFFYHNIQFSSQMEIHRWILRTARISLKMKAFIFSQ